MKPASVHRVDRPSLTGAGLIQGFFAALEDEPSGWNPSRWNDGTDGVSCRSREVAGHVSGVARSGPRNPSGRSQVKASQAETGPDMGRETAPASSVCWLGSLLRWSLGCQSTAASQLDNAGAGAGAEDRRDRPSPDAHHRRSNDVGSAVCSLSNGDAARRLDSSCALDHESCQRREDGVLAVAASGFPRSSPGEPEKQCRNSKKCRLLRR